MASWFQISGDDTLKKLAVEAKAGLSQPEAERRLKEYGPNRIETIKPPNPARIFLSQFKDVLIAILLLTALVSFVVSFLEEDGSVTEPILILVIVLAIALVGFFNEYKAERTIDALRKLVDFKAKVRRDGKVVEISADQLVPGDIVLLEEGQKIPADIRLLHVSDLRINEASLTGESLPASKNVFTVKDKAVLADQKNMAFAGTLVAAGTAEGVVVETGMHTELRHIAELIESVKEEPTPMQRKLDDLGKKLGILIGIVCAVVFIVIFLTVDKAEHPSTMQQFLFAFTAAVALAVAAIPEGLAFVVRISLAFGARRMADKNALVRKLSAVEALGSTDIICTDKTGTLTSGQMTVRELYVGGQHLNLKKGADRGGKELAKSRELLFRVGVLCSNAHKKGDALIGDPTETALLNSAEADGMQYEAVRDTFPRVNEIPFSSDRKLMTTVHADGQGFFIAQKGATEHVLENCRFMLDGSGKKVNLTHEDKQKILTQNHALAGKALRVLALAYKESTEHPDDRSATESNLIFIGLQAMMDPPRPEVIDVIHRVQAESGIKVVMITGDNIETARAIAKEIGLKGEAISGKDIDSMSQAEFEDRVEEITVYARVNPEHKIRIVQALKKHGHQVAMTGDGVNDAPAIKAADIGIAMGITGTDTTKEAADLVLLDDQFLTIVSAIEEGRGIFDNVRKFVNFLISCNIAEVIAILVGIIVFQNLLLTAAQILFINILTDGLPALALGSDPSEKGILKSRPRHFQEPILTKRIWLEICVFGSLMSSIILVHYALNLSEGSAIASVSAVFLSTVIYEKVRLIDIRTEYDIPLLANPLLIWSILLTLVVQLLVMYIPATANFFSVQPVTAGDWLYIAIASAILFVTMKALNPVFDRVGTET